MTNRLKPIPKNQADLSQESINAPYLDNGKPISSTTFSKNRAEDISSRGDSTKDVSIGLEDIDTAVLYYFENVINPTVIQNGQRIAVPIIYGSPERWKSVQADGFYRDASGRLMVPLIMIKRNSISKNRSIGNKLDGNKAHLYQVVGERYNNRNIYDTFSLLNNRIPPKQYYISAVPDYVTITYNCIIFTDFIEQNNKIVEAVEFASDSYWGNPDRFKFRANIDSFNTTTLLESGQDRAAKTSFDITLNGYIIPDTVNKDLAVASSKFFTKAQAVFVLETIQTTTVENKAPNAAAASAAEATVEQIIVTSTPKSAMGSSTPVDSYNVSITNNTNINVAESGVLTYLNTNIEVTGTYVNSTTIRFAREWLIAPSPLPTTSVDNFVFFCNGQNIEKSAIVSFTQSVGLSTLVINPTVLGYSFESTDLILAIGKFA